MLPSSQFPSVSQPEPELMFKKIAIERLQLRILCLINTKQYVEFNESFSRKETFSLNTIVTIINSSSKEKKTGEKHSNSGCDLLSKIFFNEYL